MTAVSTTVSARERELAAIISSYNEVTERLKASHEMLTRQVHLLREELAEKNRELDRKERLAALGEMAAGVAHEVRNPLGGIQLFASLLERDLADRPKLRELAAKISKGVRTLDAIVGDILVFAGQGEARLEPVSLAAVLSETLDLVAPQRRARDARIHVDTEQFQVAVEGHAGQLQRALLNLVFNALDAAGEGGNVWITCREDPADEAVYVEVADDGPGVPPDMAQRIFNPFFTRKDHGTGLGLAIVHRVAEAHGGGVRVRNRPEGGAAFVLSLRPAAERPIGGG
ncbi:MAG TPA: ATP-binding protein [Phycisphaerae bacterium]|nr:ATP-binding protein [Phycisphaerae bacterium]